MSVELKLSMNIKLGSKTIPLTSPPINQLAPPSKEAVQAGTAQAKEQAKEQAKAQAQALKDKFKEGMSFELPPGTTIKIQLQEIVDFIKKTVSKITQAAEGTNVEISGLDAISNFFEGENATLEKFLQLYITISAFYINTKGEFSIAVELSFGEKGALETLLPEEVATQISDIIDIQSIGVAFDYRKPVEVDTQSGSVNGAKAQLPEASMISNLGTDLLDTGKSGIHLNHPSRDIPSDAPDMFA